jgi:hypothetical protein
MVNTKVLAHCLCTHKIQVKSVGLPVFQTLEDSVQALDRASRIECSDSGGLAVCHRIVLNDLDS